MVRLTMLRSSLRLAGPTLLLCVAFATAVRAAPGEARKTFESRDDAVAAVVADLKSDNLDALQAIFGVPVKRLLHSGDPVADRNARQRFVAAKGAGSPAA